MKNNNKIGKRLLCVGLFFLLPLNSFATSVSDNDGSAFITKAEFDSLKNNFQSQIDQYNQSIDSKIDGAIASYLSGIRLDEAKRYKVYGYDIGIWKGKRANNFYLVSTGNQTFGWASSTSHYMRLHSYSKSDPLGLGSGYWLYGLKDDVAITGLQPEQVGYVAHNQMYTDPYANYMNYRIGRTGGTTTQVSKTDDQIRAILDEMYQYDLGSVFQEKIRIIDPKFRVYEFFDAGDVTISAGWVSEGYSYEGHEHGGRAGAINGKPTFVLRKTNGTETTVIPYASLVDSNWYTASFHVAAGDQVIITIQLTGGFAGAYSIVYLSRDIPGWELETT